MHDRPLNIRVVCARCGCALSVKGAFNMPEKLNVCLMNDSFPPVIDGVANAVVNYANVISSQLGNATVVTPAYPNVVDN